MPQTLLALCGIIVATFLTLQSQRHRALSSEDIVGVEASEMGARVTMDVLNGFRAIPFDESIVAGPTSSAAALHHHLPLQAKAADRFEQMQARRAAAAVNLTPSATIATLDHADGRTFVVTRATAEGTLTFRVEAAVGYVQADGQTISPTPTKLKMATVRVSPVTPTPVPPIVLSQLYACGSGCPW